MSVGKTFDHAVTRVGERYIGALAADGIDAFHARALIGRARR